MLGLQALLSLLALLPFQQTFDSALNDGNVHYDRKDWEKALESYQKALKINPKSAEAQALIGSVYGQMKRLDEAVIALKKAMELDGYKTEQTVYAAKELGLNLGLAGRYEESIQAFQEGLKIDPKNEVCLRNIGLSYVNLQRLEEAVAVWDAVLKVNPNQPTIRADLTRIKKALEEREAAKPAPEPDSTPKPAEPPPTPPAETVPPSPGRKGFNLPTAGGWATTPDGLRLVVSLPSEGEIVYYDTDKEEEISRVRVDFRPGAMVIQGNSLYVAGVGATLLYVLDFSTGKLQREIKLPGEPLIHLAAHPSRGLIYASNGLEQVVTVDPQTNRVTTTQVRGQFVAVDPDGGAFLYTSRSSPRDFDKEVEKKADGTSAWYFDSWGYRSMLRKYAIQGKELRLLAANDNAAVNGGSMHVSPDGKRVMVVGSSGWRAKQERGGGYVVAIFDATDLTTMLGQVEVGAYPQNIAFHPVLNLGVALRSRSILHYFRAKSLITYQKSQVEAAPTSEEPGWVTFGTRGTKVLYWQPEAKGSEKGSLFMLPLDLTSEERLALEKKFPKDRPAGLTPPKAPESTPQQLLSIGRQMELNNSTSLALKYYRRVVDEHPGTPEAEEARKRIAALPK